MKKSAERVRALVASGAISQKDGDALLASLDGGTPKSSVYLLLFNPFERIGGATAAALGIAIAAASIGLANASRRVRFDGFVDLHIVATQPSLRVSLIDQLHRSSCRRLLRSPWLAFSAAKRVSLTSWGR
jgi:hypothetical protein